MVVKYSICNEAPFDDSWNGQCVSHVLPGIPFSLVQDLIPYDALSRTHYCFGPGDPLTVRPEFRPSLGVRSSLLDDNAAITFLDFLKESTFHTGGNMVKTLKVVTLFLHKFFQPPFFLKLGYSTVLT